jgi:hypothetical protein
MSDLMGFEINNIKAWTGTILTLFTQYKPRPRIGSSGRNVTETKS